MVHCCTVIFWWKQCSLSTAALQPDEKCTKFIFFLFLSLIFCMLGKFTGEPSAEFAARMLPVLNLCLVPHQSFIFLDPLQIVVVAGQTLYKCCSFFSFILKTYWQPGMSNLPMTIHMFPFPEPSNRKSVRALQLQKSNRIFLIKLCHKRSLQLQIAEFNNQSILITLKQSKMT